MIEQAAAFMTSHARLLDRRRFEHLLSPGDQSAQAVVAALAGYHNPDGGYGWGIEPDLRAPESQPAGALHALEAYADAGVVEPGAARLLDWLRQVSLPDGGLPLALPIADPTACAPFWEHTDTHTSSLQITTAIAAQAHRLARHDPQIAAHPWLRSVTRFCLDRIRALEETPVAHVLSFALQFLDAAADDHPEARDLLPHLGRFVPTDGAIPVQGGADGESLRLLDYAPLPARPVRALLDGPAVAAALDLLAEGQQADGGWGVDFDSFSSAAALEWRGYATVRAISVLRSNGR